MNPLELHIFNEGLDEVRVMNRLQQHGVISDNCRDAEDVDFTDADKAVEWLKENPE